MGGAFEQPAATISSAAAPASPSRVRNLRATGSVNSAIRAKAASAICCIEIGGLRSDVGGTSSPFVTIVTFPVPGAVTALEGAEQLPAGIDAEQVSVTAPVKPPTPVTVTAIVPEAPGLTVTGKPLSVKSHAVPVKGTVCGLPAALSVMVNVAA